MSNIYFKEMKKFFSLIALVGVIAACTPEQVDTAFKLSGGKVLVDVEVVDIINGGEYSGDVNIKFLRGGLDVTSEFTQIVGAGPHAYMYQADESQAVSPNDYVVEVKGSELAKAYTSSMAVPEVLAGGEAAIRVIVPVGEPINGWTVDTDYDEDAADTGENVYFLVNTHYPTHAYSHNGIDTWYYNNSEYILEGTVDYVKAYSDEVSNVVDHNYVGFEGIVDNLIDYEDWDWPWYRDRTYTFQVSAWAMWNVRQTDWWLEMPVKVIAFKDADEDGEADANEEYLELGSFDYRYVETVEIQVYELPYPGAPGHAHYHYGHGHDAHGAAANAGGGISYNE